MNMIGGGRRTTPENFWARVSKTEECWLWTGRLNEDGYGRVGYQGKPNVGAHRVSWAMSHDGILPDQSVLHRCDNPRCVRPDHLFLGSTLDNNQDRHAKGRSRGLFCSDEKHPARVRKGGRHWAAKLSDAQVSEIRARRAAGETVTALATAFKVNHGTISRIARREWRKEEA